MNTFVYRIKTPEGYYYTTNNEEAEKAYQLGAIVNCGRITNYGE